ncbi:MAG: hypothetical protein KOO61_04755 [Spirochaetales bacterium]|nr:hypothetical protein [Spirochaetales bacterium]
MAKIIRGRLKIGEAISEQKIDLDTRIGWMDEDYLALDKPLKRLEADRPSKMRFVNRLLCPMIDHAYVTQKVPFKDDHPYSPRHDENSLREARTDVGNALKKMDSMGPWGSIRCSSSRMELRRVRHCLKKVIDEIHSGYAPNYDGKRHWYVGHRRRLILGAAMIYFDVFDKYPTSTGPRVVGGSTKPASVFWEVLDYVGGILLIPKVNWGDDIRRANTIIKKYKLYDESGKYAYGRLPLDTRLEVYRDLESKIR